MFWKLKTPDFLFFLSANRWMNVVLTTVHEKKAPVSKYTNTDLLWDWQLWEVWDVPGPLNGAEEESGSQLTDAVDAHDGGSARRCLHLCLAVGGPITAAGVGLSPEELGDELWHRLPVEVIRPNVTRPWPSNSTCQGVGTDTWMRRRDPAPLNSCRGKRDKKMRISNWETVYCCCTPAEE